MSVAVCYPDTYAVEETFQLLKIPWEWYVDGRQYDVVIARKPDVPGWTGNLIDLTTNDFFSRIATMLNTGRFHMHEPACDSLIDTLRQELRRHTVLAEIPPAPWGHPYMVALTHDVDVTSVRECRLATAGYAAFRCMGSGMVSTGLRLGFACIGIGDDPWALFDRWKTCEEELGVRSTFFFVPRKNDPGVHAHPYRAIRYNLGEKTGVLRDLEQNGWETGVHGIDNWTDAARGKEELKALGTGTKNPGNRTHWLLFDRDSWRVLDEAGYSYDTTFGYNDDAGFRAGTLQVYKPRDVQDLLELPLHIQDIGLFGKFCWAPSGTSWEKIPCLRLDEREARTRCDGIFDYARTFGGAVTILWHYENLVPPRNWSGIYVDLVKRAQADGAWVTTAGAVVKWFRKRRETGIEYDMNKNVLTIRVHTSPAGCNPPLLVRVHINPARVVHINAAYNSGDGYVDIMGTVPEITVTLT